MENLKDPGIAIEIVRLLKAQVEIKNPKGVNEYNLRLIGFHRVELEAGKYLTIQASFDLMHGIEKPLIAFTCEFVVQYVRRGEDSMQWKDFSSATALAHIIPYLREFVSNITNRLPTPVLMLDPVNTNAMLKDFEDRQKQAQPVASPPQPLPAKTESPSP